MDPTRPQDTPGTTVLPARASQVGSAGLSLIVPCYNEEGVVGYSIPKLVTAFREAGRTLQLIAVDNGSTDSTGAKLKALAGTYSEIVVHRVEVNQGYGYGVISATAVANQAWVGIIPCDGQVDAKDVVELFEAADASGERLIAKVRRRFRLDGLMRKVVSVSYNLFVRLLWPRLGSIDINGTPKLFPRDLLPVLELSSHGWLLDPELMIKAHYLGVRVLEYNVFGRMRGAGLSHVRPSACIEFFTALLAARFTGRWHPRAPAPAPVGAPAPSSGR